MVSVVRYGKATESADRYVNRCLRAPVILHSCVVSVHPPLSR